MLGYDLLSRLRDLPERYHLTISGQGEQSVVLGNGFGTNLGLWQGVLPWLESRFRVVRFDWVIDPAHFDTARYSSLDGFAEDLLAILVASNATPCLYVGQSMGAMAGMLAAKKRPDFFRAMVMLAPSPCFINRPGYEGGFEQGEMESLLQRMATDYMEWVKAFSPLVVAQKPGDRAATEFARCLLGMRPDVAFSMALTVFKMDLRDRLDGFSIPTTIVQTRHDMAVPLAVAHYLRDRWPHARLEVIDAEGHLPHLTAPDEVVRVLRGAFGGEGV